MTYGDLSGQPGATERLVGADGVRVLEAASLAASSHNIQPWLVRVAGPRTWILCADPGRRLPAVDPSNREPILSLGAFLENLTAAAGALGYAVEVTPLTQDRFGLEVAEVHLEAARPTPFPLERLTLRRTLRGGYAREPLATEHVRRLLEPFQGSAQYFEHDSEAGRYLRAATVEAFRQQTWRDDAQRELAEWIHFDSREALRERSGLTTATMEITGLAGWFVRTFFDKETVLSESFREKGIRGVEAQVERAGGWIVVGVDDLSVSSLLQAGRDLQAMLLGVREMGIAAHPMSQVIQESPWREEVAAQLGVRGVPQVVLRLGYVDRYPMPVSLRRPVDDLLLDRSGAPHRG